MAGVPRFQQPLGSEPHMTPLSNRTLAATVAVLALAGCARTESPRPRLLAASDARISAIDPAVLADTVFVPVTVERDARLVLVTCSLTERSERPRLLRPTDCVIPYAAKPRIL